jgi:cytoskeletal protein RodZ
VGFPEEKMSEKENEKQEWTDPRDFGLPFVNPVPLHPEVSKTSETPPAPESTGVSMEKPKPQVDSGRNQGNDTKSKRHKLKKKKSPLSWLWVVLTLAFLLVGVIVWQLGLGNLDFLVSKFKPAPLPTLPAKVTPKPVEELKTSDKNQPADNQDSTASAANSTLVVPQPAETGTTIANTTPVGKLIRVDSKGEKARYFLVVASLPNEKLALELAEKFSGKSPELYLITPFGTSTNYRIAISKFDTWNAASQEKERIKPQFSEDLWILTY